jgi:aldose 1-epimerase
MSTVALQNEYLRLVVDPENGAGTLAFSALINGQWLALMPDTQSSDGDLACANFLMVPYSNRIENGRFEFAGQTHQLQNGDQHAIHGDVRKRPWHIAEQSADRLRCTFSSAEYTEINWPWPFAAEALFALKDSSLHMHLALTNQGETPMPAGFGWHPYFSRSLTKAGEAVALQFDLDGAYPDANDTRIPSGPLAPLAPHQDFSREKVLAPDNFLDTCCYGFDGGYITWPESGVRLRLLPSANCRHLVLYNPAGTSYFAVEPVTNANNGANLLAQDDPTCGTIFLAPGATLAADCTLSLEHL